MDKQIQRMVEKTRLTMAEAQLEQARANKWTAIEAALKVALKTLIGIASALALIFRRFGWPD